MKEKGRIHVKNGLETVKSINDRIFIEDIKNNRRISFKVKLGIFSFSHFLSRLTRQAIHHVFSLEKKLIVFVKGEVRILDKEDGKTLKSIPIKGSRPLVPTSFDNKVYFGEYFSNANRNGIKLFELDPDEGKIKEILHFKDIRHIHGVFKDPFSQKVYITTGDYGEENGVWEFDIANNFCQKIIGGNQQARAVSLLFTENYIFYGTDTPLEENYICRIDKEKPYDIVKIQKVSSSVFYAFQNDYFMAFSTAIEPSEINFSREVEIWISVDGGKCWKCVIKHRKDKLPFLFQYGQAIFPIENNYPELIYYSFATLDSNFTHFIPLNKIK